jgi:H+/Cl- antiporter ClcA
MNPNLIAFIALAFMETLERTNAVSKRLAMRFPLFLMSGFVGLILGIMGLFYPEALELGYDFIHKITATELGQLSIVTLQENLIAAHHLVLWMNIQVQIQKG